MMKTLLGRLLGDGAEPATVDLDADLDAPGRPDPDCGKLIATGCADPRAFYDAPPLRRLGRSQRLRSANHCALEVARHCPRWFSERLDPARDLLFCAWISSRHTPVAVEAELFGEGGRARQVSPFRGDERWPGTDWSDLDPAVVLELDLLLRRGGFSALPALDGREGLDGEMWYLSRVERGRHHLVRRFCPRDRDRDLLLGTMRLLGLDVEAIVAEDERRWAAERQEQRESLRGRARAFVAAHRTSSCAWASCGLPAAPTDPSGLCEAHRRRVDAQGANFSRRRKR